MNRFRDFRKAFSLALQGMDLSDIVEHNITFIEATFEGYKAGREVRERFKQMEDEIYNRVTERIQADAVERVSAENKKVTE